ncbi:fimbrial protein [Lonsdalea quercina]|uniref:fimbrial protein n=1 Tax=Lonsdalea quercina TaxID=71657 RepID=UPI0039748D49
MTKRRASICRTLHGVLWAYMVSFSTCAFASGSEKSQDYVYDVGFHVRVVDSPCVLSTDSENIDVDMGEESARTLQTDQAGEWRDFSIVLTRCSTETLQDVVVSFSGKENTALTGRLAIDPASVAKGVAIGIYRADQLLPLNGNTGKIPLLDGDNRLDFRARLEKVDSEPLAMGSYSATAHFTLSYQ